MDRLTMRQALWTIAAIVIAAASMLAVTVAPASAKPSEPSLERVLASKGINPKTVVGVLRPQAITQVSGAPTYCAVSAPVGIFVTDRASIFTLFNTDCFWLDDGQPSRDIVRITMNTQILLGGAPYSATKPCSDSRPFLQCTAEAGFPGPAGTYRGATTVQVCNVAWACVEGFFTTIAQVSI